MKLLNYLSFSVVIAFAGCKQESFEPVTLTNFADSLAYSYGVEYATSLKNSGKELNPEIIAAAIKEAMADKSQIPAEQCQMIMRQDMDRENMSMVMENKTWLSENGAKEGVQTTASGLQYKVLTPGTGKKPNVTSTVTVHYAGSLIDGTEFDSSIKRGEPAQFPLNRVIPGWTEGVQLMSEGAKYEFYIPSELGYGQRGAGNAIPPNSTLIFTVELISVDSE